VNAADGAARIAGRAGRAAAPGSAAKARGAAKGRPTGVRASAEWVVAARC